MVSANSFFNFLFPVSKLRSRAASGGSMPPYLDPQYWDNEADYGKDLFHRVDFSTLTKVSERPRWPHCNVS